MIISGIVSFIQCIFNGNGSSDNKELEDHFSRLPQDCQRMVMKLSSPKDACRSAAVCTTFHSLLDSDDIWEHFLPTDLISSILSRAGMDNNQLPLKKKDIYLYLSHNWIGLDGGIKRFRLDLLSGAKKIMLPEKSLVIIDSRETTIPLFYISGRINCKDLSHETNYAAYLIFTGIPNSGPGVHHDLQNNEQNDFLLSTLLQATCDFYKHYLRFCTVMSNGRPLSFIYKECKKGVWQESQMREDGQWEVKMGNIFTCFQEDEELSFYFIDDNTKLLKSELTVTGIEVRPED